jgi:hypothetical protein
MSCEHKVADSLRKRVVQVCLNSMLLTNPQGVCEIVKGEACHNVAVTIGWRHTERDRDPQVVDKRDGDVVDVKEFLDDFAPGRMTPIGVRLLASSSDPRKYGAVAIMFLNACEDPWLFDKENTGSLVLRKGRI